MFDIADPAARTITHKESPIPQILLPATGDDGRLKKPKALDSDSAKQLHGRLLDIYTRELDRQEENRIEMAIDEDFYDNIMWSEDDANALRERGQVPLVYNVIKSTVNWVIGTEKRGRSDYKILARRKEESKQAEKKTALMKYLSDQSRLPFARSQAFEDAVKVGVGWLEDGVQDDLDGEPVFSGYENWRNMLYDSAATLKDLSDARYVIRSKWLDQDIGNAIFHDRQEIIAQSVDDSDRFFTAGQYGDEAMDSRENEMEMSGAPRADNRFQRNRFRAIEMWFTTPKQVDRLRGGTFHGEIFDEYSEGHAEEINQGKAKLVKRPMLRMHVAIFGVAGLLWLSESPYRHNKFPFTPIWGYRRGRDGLPYGMIRDLRDINIDINKTASKILHILSTSKVIMDEGAVEDIDEFMNEVARPDAVIVKRVGKELNIDVDRGEVQWHLERMSRSSQMIQVAGGVTDENMGRRTNATSGVAIEKRQDQGSVATTNFFDNLRFASQVQGEKQLSNVEQFFSKEKEFRITNMRGTPEYVKVNDGLPENSIARCKADYVISEADWRATMRQAAVDSLMEAAKNLPPEITMIMLDLIVENMDLPNREEIVRRIRSVNGQRDPDADEPTPEEIARAQENAEAKQMQKALLQAQLNKLVGEGAKSAAQAKEVASKIVGNNVDAIAGAIAAAQLAVSTPAAVPASDFMLHEAGFISRTEAERMAQRAAELAFAKAQQAAIAEGAAAPGATPIAPPKAQTMVQAG